MDEEEALRALLPMLSGTVETAREKGLANALAGPVSRGDAGIVERQLALLDGMGGDHATLYALMTRRAVELARRRATPPGRTRRGRTGRERPARTAARAGCPRAPRAVIR